MIQSIINKPNQFDWNHPIAANFISKLILFLERTTKLPIELYHDFTFHHKNHLLLYSFNHTSVAKWMVAKEGQRLHEIVIASRWHDQIWLKIVFEIVGADGLLAVWAKSTGVELAKLIHVFVDGRLWRLIVVLVDEEVVYLIILINCHRLTDLTHLFTKMLISYQRNRLLSLVYRRLKLLTLFLLLCVLWSFPCFKSF